MPDSRKLLRPVQPYLVTRVAKNAYSFATDHHLIYNCQFTNVTELYGNFGIADLTIYSFDFFPEGYSPARKLKAPQDERVAVTIAHLLRQRLQEPNQAVFFTCDDTWQKPQARQRLFEGWHKVLGADTELVLFPNEEFLAAQAAAGVYTMIGGMLMRTDYEHYTQLLNLMDEVLPMLFQEKNGL